MKPRFMILRIDGLLGRPLLCSEAFKDAIEFPLESKVSKHSESLNHMFSPPFVSPQRSYIPPAIKPSFQT